MRDDRGRLSTARVYLRFCPMTVHPPVGKQKRYTTLSLTVIHAHERGKPEGREPIRWHLLTDLPVTRPVAGDREARLVRVALESGNLSQGPEIGVPGRAGQAPHG